ncbi:MAG: hypothetical protein Q7S66_04030 [bacterium]|nr:hypothetical protein [bacterium]
MKLSELKVAVHTVKKRMPNFSSSTDSIKNTLAYFGLFNHTLTADELYGWLWRPPANLTREDFLLSLRATERSVAIPWLQDKYGFYFLPGAELSVETRRRAALTSDLKMKIARRAAKKLRAVPFLRAIFVCNSVGAGQAKSESDIDFFIVAAAGRVWIVRWFCNLILRLWGLRTYGTKLRDRICLSFFVDENNLDLEKFQGVEEDVHFIYWTNQKIPLYDAGGMYERFTRANSWVKKYLPNLPQKFAAGYAGAVADTGIGRIWKTMWETLWRGAYGDLIERQARALQWHILPLSVKEMANTNTATVINDVVISLHHSDSRAQLKSEWEAAARQLSC